MQVLSKTCNDSTLHNTALDPIFTHQKLPKLAVERADDPLYDLIDNGHVIPKFRKVALDFEIHSNAVFVGNREDLHCRKPRREVKKRENCPLRIEVQMGADNSRSFRRAYIWP